jgi:alpha-tubulin suppressor-like RCC1 family protein
VRAEHPLLSLVDVIAVAVGGSMSAAVTGDGTLFTTGNPENGRLGRYVGEGTYSAGKGKGAAENRWRASFQQEKKKLTKQKKNTQT